MYTPSLVLPENMQPVKVLDTGTSPEDRLAWADFNVHTVVFFDCPRAIRPQVTALDDVFARLYEKTGPLAKPCISSPRIVLPSEPG